MHRAHQRNANALNKFYFRKHMAPPPSPVTPGSPQQAPQGSDTLPATEQSVESVEDNYEEMTMDEIFNGKDCYFPGLIPLVHAYLDYINTDPETRKRLNQYLQFISRRAKGESITAATWMRKFVSSHPAYTQDSIISPEVAHDLLMACKQVGEGILPCPDILGDIVIDRVRPQDAAGQVLEGRLNSEERRKLIKRLVKRAKKTKPDNIARGTFRSFEADSESDGELSAETIRSTDHVSQVLLNECEPCEGKRRKLPTNICEG